MVIVGLSKKKNNKMNDNQGFMVDENLIERKKD
jgi:hypothetical protein